MRNSHILIGATPRAAQGPLLALSVLRRCPWRCLGGWKPTKSVSHSQSQTDSESELADRPGEGRLRHSVQGGLPGGPPAVPYIQSLTRTAHPTPGLCVLPILHMPPADAGGPPAQAPAPSPSVSPSLELGLRSSWAEGRRGCGAAVCRELRAHSCVRAWQEVFAGAVGGPPAASPHSIQPCSDSGRGDLSPEAQLAPLQDGYECGVRAGHCQVLQICQAPRWDCPCPPLPGRDWHPGCPRRPVLWTLRSGRQTLLWSLCGVYDSQSTSTDTGHTQDGLGSTEQTLSQAPLNPQMEVRGSGTAQGYGGGGNMLILDS